MLYVFSISIVIGSIYLLNFNKKAANTYVFHSKCHDFNLTGNVFIAHSEPKTYAVIDNNTANTHMSISLSQIWSRPFRRVSLSLSISITIHSLSSVFLPRPISLLTLSPPIPLSPYDIRHSRQWENYHLWTLISPFPPIPPSPLITSLLIKVVVIVDEVSTV